MSPRIPRLQLLEFEDLAWCPQAVRDGLTDYLEFVLGSFAPYHALIPRMAAALDATSATCIVDLGAGAGGPWRRLLPEICRHTGKPLSLLLTDLYPHASASCPAHLGMGVSYWRDPVDARRVPEALAGFRTQFGAFHHLAPADARRVLEDAVRSRQGIVIAEITERRLVAILRMAVVPFAILLGAPFMRPIRWERLFWTYLLPVIPAVALLDAVVSCLRTYTAEELLGLAREAGANGYEWEAGRERSPDSPFTITWLIGYPSRRTGVSSRRASPGEERRVAQGVA